MGLILGGSIFALASMKKPDLLKTARNCYTLALIFIPFTVIVGIMDWQYRLYGKGSGLITAKFVLAVVMSLLVFLTIRMSRKEKPDTKIMALYVLTALNAVAMGFIGGEILYG